MTSWQGGKPLTATGAHTGVVSQFLSVHWPLSLAIIAYTFAFTLSASIS